MNSVQTTTTNIVPEERVCPRCGAPLGGFGPEGLCGACLLGSGLDEAESAGASPPPAGPPRFGDYELLGEIARGGMGVVYRARQVGLDRVVALKMILSGQGAGPEELQRFRQEAGAAAQLKHPNIVGIHEVGEQDGQPFFSMDFIEGQTLRQLTRDNPLSAQSAAACLKTVAEAVHYAHERGVVHRDLKPSNVLMDAAGQPHVTDFGLAKRIGSEVDLTMTGAAMGTPGYMPPEQARGQTRSVGPLADVYALGAMLYDLLTGRPPFRGETPVETMTQVMNEEPVAPRLLNASVPRDLETICLKCLEKEPARRYATAQALSEDLGRFLNHEPIQAAPPSALYRASKFVRRHRVGVAVAACFVVVLTTATVVSITYGVRADREKAAALQAKLKTEKAEGLATKRLNEVTAERNQKEQARQAAEAAREEAEGVSQFLIQVFQSPDPSKKGGGRTNTVAASLDAAVVKLDKDLSLRPERRATLQAVIANTYHELGLYPEAIALWEKVITYYQISLGPEHDDALDAMNNLANSYYQAFRHEEALKLHELVLTLCHKLLGPEHERTLTSQNNLANSYQAVGRREKALELREEVLTLSRKVHGLEHPNSLRAMGNLADSYDDAGRWEAALKLREEALMLSRKVLGPEHLDTHTAMNNLARSYREAGRGEESLDLRQEVLTFRRKVLGPEHSDTVRAMERLAISYHYAGRREEALELREEVLTIRRKLLGPVHPDTLGAMQNLASSYDDVGRREEALKLREEVLTLYRKVLGPEHSETLDAMHNLAVTYENGGRREEALKLREEVLTLSRKVLWPEHLNIRTALQNLAKSYASVGRRAEALKLREEEMALCRKFLGPEHPKTLGALHDLAISYHDAGRLEEALKLREEVLTQHRKLFGPQHSGTISAMESMAISYNASGRHEEALKLQAEVLTLRRNLHGAEHPDTLTAMGNLAVYYRDAGRQEKALELQEDVLRLRRKVLGAEHPKVISAMNNLAVFYYSTGRREEALRLREEVLTLYRKVLEAGHPDTLMAMRNLTISYQDAGRQEEALKLREEVLTLYRKVRGSTHPDTLEAMNGLATSYEDAGRLDDARKLREEQTVATARGTNASPAELSASLSELRRLYPAGSQALAQRLVLFGEGLLRQGDCTNAEPLLRECLAIYEKEQPGLSPLFNAQGLLGWSMLCQKNFGEAARLLLLAHEGLEKRQIDRPSSDRAATLRDIVTRLAALYEAWGKPDEAAKWGEKAK